jgi:hypothetical protein
LIYIAGVFRNNKWQSSVLYPYFFQLTIVKGFCEGVEQLVEERMEARVDLVRGEEYNLSILRAENAPIA